MTWSAEQRRNANIIMDVGRKMGMSWTDVTVALMTAMQESGLRNLNYGDSDSLGLFQQRPSQGWGTPQQVTDPVYAATKFYTALKGIKDRSSMSLTAQAQAVQRSAYPDAYAKWQDAANMLVRDAVASGIKITSAANTAIPDLPQAVPGGQVGISADQVQQLMAPPEVGNPIATLSATTDSTAGLTSSLETMATAAPSIPGVEQAGLSGMQPFQNPDQYQALLTQQGLTPNMGQPGVDQSRLGIVNFAKQFLGTPYVWGGTNLKTGVDCSGLVQAVYSHFGIHLPRISYQQANFGQRVALDQLRPGDLVAWNNSSRNPGADHIAIYAGNGMIIEAPRPGRSVQLVHLYDTNIAWGVRMNLK
ncbi:MAG: C40 family peptidase [Mycobacteriaceae bacterium]